MKKISVIITLLFCFFAMPGSVLALGQVTQPINITNALRGEKIHQELIAVNGENKVIAIEFTASGQIKDWVKFYKPADLKNPISTTTMAANSNLNVIAVFSVPAEAPNGDYKGAVSVTKAPDQLLQKEQTQTSIAQKIDRSVSIKISDKETINLVASVIPGKYDLKPGEPLSIRIIYDNQSNVSLRPSISFKIKNSEKTFYNVIYPYPEEEIDVNPKAMHEIPALEIPLMNMAEGEYTAELEFLRNDKSILESHFGFTIKTDNVVYTSKVMDFFSKGQDWLLWLLALILLVIMAVLVKKNIKIRQDLKRSLINLKKVFLKAVSYVRTGITGLF